MLVEIQYLITLEDNTTIWMKHNEFYEFKEVFGNPDDCKSKKEFEEKLMVIRI